MLGDIRRQFDRNQTFNQTARPASRRREEICALNALSFQEYHGKWALTGVQEISPTDIRPDDTRIFVAREADIDWLAEAVEAYLNRETGR